MTSVAVATVLSQVVLEVNEQKLSSNFYVLWSHYFTAETEFRIANRQGLARPISRILRSKYQGVKADFYLNCFLNFVV